MGKRLTWAQELQKLRARLQEAGQSCRPGEGADGLAEIGAELGRLANLAADADQAGVGAERLASFPEMNPNPVLEVSRDGRISYHNPAAAMFLKDRGLPEDIRLFLPGDWDSLARAGASPGVWYREVAVGDRVVGEHISFAPEFSSFRIYAVDVTEHVQTLAMQEQTLAELGRREREISALLEAARSVLQQSDFQTAAGVIFQGAKEFIGAKAGYVSLVNEPRQENEVVFMDPGEQTCRVSEGTPMPIRGLREECLRSGRVVFDNNYGESSHYRFLPEGHVPLKSVLFAPLMVQGKAVGLLGLADKPGGFTEEDARVAEAFAELGAVALVDKWARESLQRVQEELEARVRERTAALETANEQLRREVRKRRRVETALDEQADIIEAFFQNSVMPLAILDKDFNFVRVNEAYARACERRVEDFPGHNHFELYPSEAQAIFEEVVRTRRPFETRARPFVFPDHPEWGETYWDWSLAPIVDGQGEVEYLVFCLDDVTEEVRGRATQAQLSGIIEMAPDVVATADCDGKLLYMNRAGRRLLEVGENEEVSGIEAREFHSPASWEIIRDEAVPMALEKGVWEGETVFRTRGGQEVPASQVILSHTAADGTVKFISTIARDISERKQAEAALHRLNRALMTLSAGAQAVVRARGEKEVLNDICELVTHVGGYRLAWIGFVGEDEEQSVYPAALAGEEQDYVKAIKVSWGKTQFGQGPSGEAVRTGKTVVARDLKTAPGFSPWRKEAHRRGLASAMALPLKDDKGVFGVLNIYSPDKDAFDAEEIALMERLAENLSHGIVALRMRKGRQEALEALRRERDFISVLLDTIGALVVVLDPKGRIVLFNQACEQTTGYTFGEVASRPFWEIFLVPEEVPAVKEVFHRLFASSQASRFENFWLTKDGQRRWIAWSNTTLKDESGQVSHIISTGIDLTEERRLRQESAQRLAQVIQQDKLASLGEMVAGVAHEINNPNSFITYNIPLLEETWQILEPILSTYAGAHPRWRKAGLSLNEMCQDMRDIIAAIKTGSGRINRVVTNLKDFARLDQSSYTSPVNVNDVIEQTLTIVGGQVRRTNARLELELEEGLPAIQGHFHKLEQVVVNLLLNAGHALEEAGGGRITVRTRHVAPLGAVLIQVEDNGPGMESGVMARIFEPFYTTRRAGGGTGLGLSVSYGLVQEHQGIIGVQSKPGVGSCFTVYMPTDPGVCLTLRPQLLYMGVEAETVEFLRSHFIEVVTGPVVDDGAGVLGFLNEHPEVDVVLCDIAVETEAGEKALAALRAARPLMTLIVGLEAPETAWGLWGKRADFILQRPWNPQQLVALIKGMGRQRL